MSEQRINFMSIERVPAESKEPAPLTPEQKARVEEVTRFEREGNRVLKANWRRYVRPVPLGCR